MPGDLVPIERALLGLLLSDPPPELVVSVADLLSVGSFDNPMHREIYGVVLDLDAAGAPITVATVEAALRKARRLHAAGGVVYLVETAERACTAPQATWHAQRIAEAAELRQAAADAVRLSQAAETGDPAALANVRAELADQWAQSTVVSQPAVEVLTLRERLARPRDPVRYRIDGWQPVGSRVVLAAQRKAGKTTLTGSLVRSLVDGDPWLGRWRVDPIAGAVVLLDLEMSADQLDDWLGAQRIRADDRVVPITLRGQAAVLDLLDPARRTEWSARLRELGCGYLVLDCLRPVLDALGLDEQREAGRYLVALDALLSDAGVGEALLVVHMGHSGERARGDSRIRDWPDVEWRLMRQDPDDDASARYIAAYGRDVDQREARLAYDPATRHVTVGGGSRRDDAVSTALDAVLQALASEPRQSLRDLEAVAAASGHSRQTIRDAVRAGVRSRQIVTESGPRRSILHSLAATADTLPDAP